MGALKNGVWPPYLASIPANSRLASPISHLTRLYLEHLKDAQGIAVRVSNQLPIKYFTHRSTK